MSIFDGLEKFGLAHLKNSKVVTEKPEAEHLDKIEKPEKTYDIKEYVFLKEYECPACQKPFKAYTIKASKLKLVSIDDDLYPCYSNIEPLFYDAIICPSCGYSALKQNFSSLTERQADFILENITPSFKSVEYPEMMTVDLAIDAYKLVLVNALVKKAKNSEKAYICLKLSWLYKLKDDKENELNIIKEAYDSFKAAIALENPPFFGLDENTVLYLTSRLCYKLGHYEEALKILPKVITNKTVNPRLKDRALTLKDLLLKEHHGN